MSDRNYGLTIRTDAPVKLSPDDLATVKALVNQEAETPFPYYSTVKFHALAVGGAGGPYVYTVPQGTVARAFAYAFNTAMVPGGFLVADGLATLSETNLANANQTNGGESVIIRGIAALVEQGCVPAARMSDHRLLAALSTNMSIELSLNGDKNRFPLGTLPMVPGAGGLQGVGEDPLASQPIPGGRPSKPLASNGWPTKSNFFKLPEGLIWRPSGKQDGMLNLICTVTRAIALDSGGDPENPRVDEVAAAGVRGYAYPTEINVLIKFFLIGKVVTARSAVV